MAGSRFSRSDKGITNLTKAMFTDLLGLTEDTALKLIRIIRSQGQYQDMKQSIRSMSAVAHRRLNDAIDLHARLDSDVESETIHGHKPTETEKKYHPDLANQDEIESGNTETGVRESFAGFLITELQYSADEIRDPARKQEISRLMRANDQQAAQMTKRAEQTDKRDVRQDIQQEQDPKRVSLLRKKQNLEKQLAQIDQQLEATQEKIQ